MAYVAVDNFTVQIRNRSNVIEGTGFVVSSDGKIITCAHVVRDAGVDPKIVDGAEIGVFIPFLPEADKDQRQRKAKVAATCSKYDDDVVLLHLVGEPLALEPKHVAVLGTVVYGHTFSSYGYHRLDDYWGLSASGRIIGVAATPDDCCLQHKPIMLTSQNIDDGMSGAAILDETSNLVVGIVSKTWDSGSSFEDRDTAFAVAADVLASPPFNLSVCTSIVQQPLLREVFDQIIEDHTRLFGGRGIVLTRMAEMLQHPSGSVLVVTAPAGVGKTALLATFISQQPDTFVYHFFTPQVADGLTEVFLFT